MARRSCPQPEGEMQVMESTTKTVHHPCTLPSLNLPIFCLPNELLTSIFARVADLEEPTYSPLYFHSHRSNTRMLMKWVRLMLVCRHWRDVGLSSPWLWRRIGITRNLQALQYRLSRALGCTMDVFLSDDPTTNAYAMPLLLPYARRIRSINSGDSFSFDTLPYVEVLFELSLPSLESIVLLPEDEARFPPTDGDSDEEWLDLGLSCDLLPSLRRLEIRRICIPPPPACTTALQELIINMERLKSPPLDALDMIQILAHSPQLEVLKFTSSAIWNYSSASQGSANAEPGKQPQCRLLYLQEIDLSCPYDFASEILEVLDAPDLCLFCVKVFVRTPTDPGDIGDRIFPERLRHFVHQLVSLRIVPTASGRSGFYICGTHSSTRCRSHDDRKCFWAELVVEDYTGTLRDLDAALNTACTVLACAPVTRLTIADFEIDNPSPATWQRLDTTFPTLRALSVKCSDLVVVSFLRAVSESWSTLSYLSINSASQGFTPADSATLYIIFTLVLDALWARRKRKAGMVALILEHPLESSTLLVAHRWMMRDIWSLCGGQFTFMYQDYNGVPFKIDLSDVFKPDEVRRLSLEEESSTTETTGAFRRAVKDALRTEGSSEGKDTDDKHVDAPYAHAGEEGDFARNECLTFQRDVMEELLEIVERII